MKSTVDLHAERLPVAIHAIDHPAKGLFALSDVSASSDPVPTAMHPIGQRPAGHLFNSERRNRIQATFFHRVDQQPIPVGPDIEIVVDKTKTIPCGGLNTEIHRLRITEVDEVFYHPAAIGLKKGAGAVRGMIIDDNQLVGTRGVPPNSVEEELVVSDLIVDGDDNA